jgi:hypothetical protein
MKMNKSRAEELLIPLKNGKPVGISPHWRDRLIEALEYIIDNETPKKPERLRYAIDPDADIPF